MEGLRAATHFLESRGHGVSADTTWRDSAMKILKTCFVDAASKSNFNLAILSRDAHRPFGLVWPCE
jgi:hypothetical protein